jgi:hypothetical protein
MKKRVVRYSFQIFDNKLLKNLPTSILVSGKLWKAFSQLTVISTESGILMMPSSKQSFLLLSSITCWRSSSTERVGGDIFFQNDFFQNISLPLFLVE